MLTCVFCWTVSVVELPESSVWSGCDWSSGGKFGHTSAQGCLIHLSVCVCACVQFAEEVQESLTEPEADGIPHEEARDEFVMEDSLPSPKKSARKPRKSRVPAAVSTEDESDDQGM